MNKKAIEPITTTIIIIAAVLLIGGVTTGVISVSTTPPFCNDKPLNFKCLCLEGEVKTGFFPWKCEELPELPEEVIFPIETWTEAIVYVEDIMGDFQCTGEFYYTNPLTGEIYKQCDKYGSVMTDMGAYRGHLIMTECNHILSVDEQGRPTSGESAWRIDFDPNDGHIYKLACYPERGNIQCPETTFDNNWKTDVQPTCGDTCCHSGETFENCPEDCEAPSEESQQCCGDGFCDVNKVQTNYCNVDGVSTVLRKIDCQGSTSIIPLSSCDGYDILIGGVRQVKSWARITYEEETYENCPQDCSI